jgi:YfiH family protein
MQIPQTINPGIEHFPVGSRYAGWRVAHGFYGRGETKPVGALSLDQVHGNVVVDANHWTQGIKADALIATSNHIIAVKSADCVPVLLHHPAVVGAVHAGWRGLVAGAIAATVEAMRLRVGAGDARAITAVVGPTIGVQDYDVGDEFRAHDFQLTSAQKEAPWRRGPDGKWHFDLQLTAALQLLNCGVTHVAVMATSTFADGRWHSRRRDGTNFGNNWSWIQLERHS